MSDSSDGFFFGSATVLPSKTFLFTGQLFEMFKHNAERFMNARDNQRHMFIVRKVRSVKHPLHCGTECPYPLCAHPVRAAGIARTRHRFLVMVTLQATVCLRHRYPPRKRVKRSL